MKFKSFKAAQMKQGMKRRNGEYGEATFLREIRKLVKKRNWKGELHPRHRLTEKQVRAIRAVPAPLTRSSAKRLGRLFGISGGYVYHLRGGRRWKHL